MFKTYIYGTPLGFDFFEDIATLKEYFKGLYISSRKGRRLMVNRRDNGETFYNYLHYGLAEKEGRPNAFFGMSVCVDGYEYADDFKEIFDWFDYLFKKLVERESLFYKNGGNVIQYNVSKFKDNPEEIQWLKNNIPNLFTKSQALNFLKYDSTFSSSTSSQIRCFNDDTSAAVVLESFKKYRWIALSPSFKPEEEHIEIDLFDIDTQLNRYNQQLVPIAISPKRENLEILRSIKDESSDIVSLIRKYISSEKETSERKEYEQLIARAEDTKSNTCTLIDKIEKGDIEDDSYRICSKCGRYLSLSNFDSQNSPFCHDCTVEKEKKPKPQKQKCVKCGKEKPLSEFPKNSYQCYDCNKSKSIWDYISPKIVAIACIAAIFIGVSIYLVSGSKNTGEPIKPTVQENDVVVVSDNKVDSEKFNDFINNEDFIQAYDILDGKDDKDAYLRPLKIAIQSHLWKIIDEQDRLKAEENINKFFIDNLRLIEAVEISENSWITCAQAYNTLIELIHKNSLNQKQREQANLLIENLPSSPETIRQTFQRMIENMPKDEEIVTHAEQTRQQEASVKTQEKPYLEIIDNNGSEKLTGDSQRVYLDGTIVTVKSNVRLRIEDDPGRNVNPNNERTVANIEAKVGKPVVISAGPHRVTIIGKIKMI